jgi:hypothetical protein
MTWSNLGVLFIAPTFGKISPTYEIKIFDQKAGRNVVGQVLRLPGGALSNSHHYPASVALALQRLVVFLLELVFPEKL